MSIRPLSQSLPIQLLAAHDRVMSYFRPMLNRFGMTDQQWRVLRVVATQDAVDFRDLAEACLIQPASLSRMLETLEGRGWVQRAVDPRDKRHRMVTMTGKGWDVFDKASTETERAYANLEADLGDVYAPAIALLGEVITRTDPSASHAVRSARPG